MNTKKFRTKTELDRFRSNGYIKGAWEIALDLGYSGVKLFSPNCVACFPFYARRVDEDFSYINKAPKESIVYKNLDTGEMWLVGEIAQNTMKSGDTSDSEASLYGRDRYSNAMFNVIAEVGLALGMRDATVQTKKGATLLAPGNDKIVVQTGLPERYLGDANDLKDVLAGTHNLMLKIGMADWKEFHFTIEPDNIFVMSQPKGTLFSVCINRDGSFHKDAGKYLSSSVLVFDPGFGTLDLFPIDCGTVGEGETFSDLGMKRVLHETSKLIRNKYDVDIPVPAMQKYLETGVIKYFDKKNLVSAEYAFDDLLEQASTKVCNEAVNRMKSVINLGDFNYLIITGGTGEAWLEQMQEMFKNATHLNILLGNQNDDLPFIYSNVRGYYLYRFNKLGAKGA